MKKYKFNLLAIFGMMVAVGTVAFTAPSERMVADNWYEVTAEGTLISMDEFPLNCNLPSGEECALQLNQAVPEDTPRHEVSENDIIQKSYKTH